MAAKRDKRMAEVKKGLAGGYEVKEMGDLHHFVGVKVIQTPQTEEVWISQEAYAQRVLQKFGMENAKPIDTPIDASSKLVKRTEDCEGFDQGQFQSAVGSLLYLSIMTRPDIMYAVSNVAKFCVNPSKQHWIGVRRIMHYLKGTLYLGLLYKKDGSNECAGYSDGDWDGDKDNCKSTSGYMFHISGAVISWRSKKQTCVALSTAKTEHMALASAAQEAIWMQQLLTDLRNPPSEPTRIFGDNQSAICLAKNPQFHGLAKHTGIKYHFI